MLHLIHPALPRIAALEPRRLRHDALVAAAAAVALALAVNGTVSATLATAAENAAAQPQVQQFAASSALTAGPDAREDFTIDVRPPLLYPVGAGAPTGSGFGPRPQPCDACSTMHQGVDWTPGYGTPVVAMADGVVTAIGDPSGQLGSFIAIDHTIDGRTVTSVSAHLVAGSIPWSVGDRVRVGDQVGQVGNTGVSMGAHLHFELRVEGVLVDPAAWLRANGAQ